MLNSFSRNAGVEEAKIPNSHATIINKFQQNLNSSKTAFDECYPGFGYSLS